jgi:hypothetical protein
MSVQTGRTVNAYMRVALDDSVGTTIREIPVDTINGIGLEYEEKDVSAWQDAVKNSLLGQPSGKITFTGPFDTSPVAAAPVSATAPTLSGSHTVLKGIYGGNTPLALRVMFGMRHYYETGEPAFGLDYSATSGYLCSKYTVDPDTQKYTAEFVVFGSVVPSWLNTIPA